MKDQDLSSHPRWPLQRRLGARAGGGGGGRDKVIGPHRPNWLEAGGGSWQAMVRGMEEGRNHLRVVPTPSAGILLNAIIP